MKVLKTLVSIVLVLAIQLAVLVNVPSVVTAEGTTYYVDAVNGNDNNSGTSVGAAWKTLEKVNETTFTAGDKILFKAGCSWVGQLYPKGSGANGSPIIIDKYGTGANPVIIGNTDTSPDGAAVLLKHQQYWEIRNLEITNPSGRLGVKVYTSTSGISSYIKLINLTVHNVNGPQANIDERDFGGIYIANGSKVAGSRFDNVIISGCNVYDIKVIGIQTSTALTDTGNRFTNMKISDTIVHDCGQDGIILRAADYAVIEYTTVYRTGLDGLRYTAGIWAKTSNGVIIQHCESYQNTDGVYDDGMAFDFDIDVDNSILQYCYSHDNEGGFWMSCPGVETNTGNIVRYNISQNDRDKIFWLQNRSMNTQIYNNTVYVESTVTPLYHILKNGNISNTATFNNNIIYSNVDARYDKSSNLIWDYNCFYGVHNVYEPNDPHKITSDPQFVDPGSGSIGLNSVDGYKLQPTSPCINAGVSISNNGGKDYWGNLLYNSAPDIGAYEYQGVVPTPTPTSTPTPTPTPVPNSIYAEDFNSYATGSVPSGWTSSISGRVVTQEDPSATDKSMRVYNLSTDNQNTTATKSIPTQTTGEITVSYMFKAEQANQNVEFTVDSGTNLHAAVCIFADNGKVGYQSNGVVNYTDFSYIPNVWYNVKLVLNLSSRTYSIYVNDMETPIVADVPYASSNASNIGKLKVVASHGTTTVGALVDNILITK